MEFIGAFAVIFLLIFAAAMLVYLLWNALKSGCVKSCDIYIKYSEDIEGFIAHARKDSYIGRIYILLESENEAARCLSRKYDEIKIVRAYPDAREISEERRSR